MEARKEKNRTKAMKKKRKYRSWRPRALSLSRTVARWGCRRADPIGLVGSDGFRSLAATLGLAQATNQTWNPPPPVT